MVVIFAEFVKSPKNRHPRESGGPELIEFPGFPFSPSGVESPTLRPVSPPGWKRGRNRNDENGLSATFYESINFEKAGSLQIQIVGGLPGFPLAAESHFRLIVRLLSTKAG